MPYHSFMRERYEAYTITVFEMHSYIADIRSIYEETGSEKALLLLQKLEAKLQGVRDDEIRLNKQDYEELIRHPNLYSYAAVTAAHMERDRNIL